MDFKIRNPQSSDPRHGIVARIAEDGYVRELFNTCWHSTPEGHHENSPAFQFNVGKIGMTRWESSRCEDLRRLQRRNAKCRLRAF